jgi:hypothetical protein
VRVEQTEDSYWLLVEPHWERISIYEGGDVFLEEYNRTPERARHLFAAHWCVTEVCNGGFHQFFTNSTGVLAPEAEEAFEAIGLPQMASVVRRASAIFGTVYPRDRETRQDALLAYEEGREEDWNPFVLLDDEFFHLVTNESGGWEDAANRFALS